MAPHLAVSNERAQMSQQDKDRNRAFQIIKERSFGRENRTLASGKQSSFYFDMKPSMMLPEGANVLSELILSKIDDLHVDFIGGLEMGAVPLISSINLLSHHKGKPLPGFFVRKEIKKHGTMKLVEGVHDHDLQKKNVVILDDVTTSGASAMIAVEAARNAGANVVMVLSVVDRGEGAVEFYSQRGISFHSLFTAKDFLDS